MTSVHTSLEKYTAHTLFSKGLQKSWCWLCVRGELETETDCHILTPSSSDDSSTSPLFCCASRPGSWGSQALRLELALTPRTSYLLQRLELQLELQLPKPSVAPGFIIVWYPPASCGRTHVHRIQPRPQVKVIFWYLRPGAHVSWLTAQSRVNMLQLGGVLFVLRRVNTFGSFNVVLNLKQFSLV